MAQQRKKSAPRKRAAGGKPRRKKNTFTYTLLKGVIFLLIAFILAAGGYFFGYQKAKQEHRGALLTERQHSAELKKALKKAKARTASHEYEKAPPRPAARAEKVEPESGEKPMMAIIFDDVSFAHDVRNIKALNLPVTMSFLPPSKRHPDSAALAAKQSYYMVHLPMEAVSFSAEEPLTLHVGDDETVIDERIRQIKNLFPKVAFVNNHTGSKFTADRDAMERLLYALDREGITFIDSRTTGKTAVPALMKSLHRPYISRDVFLDHDPDVGAVKKQVSRAVKIAKKYGSVVVIGHPHKQTLQGLEESKALLESVQLVRIDTLAAYESHE
ncbi:divergent polysaccharide deacetylase family protein [Sulfurimonas sp. HSL-3221]|uniref:divergent polysaccharide deacetylase family protein n=1 Tax=Sulfurimonadaceae TaxID=2771471 RepID=UPI001E4AE090|nr:divergent polysaccharide deacetylase family protein [Sulfurimonas sp. HSL-3221]UFS61709.1 divergent polysaccharide deacetylase family protein [Sulfurimonas sp. HSL-3221]